MMRRWLHSLLRTSRSGGPWGPWPSGARVTVIAPWFSVRGGRVLSSLDLKSLRKCRPQVVVAPVPELRRLAAAALSSSPSLAAPELGFIALTGIQRPLLDEADRNLLWRAFQVPVFQQFHDAGGQVVAWECEAHAGLHVHTDRAVFAVCPHNSELRIGLEAGSAFWPTGFEGHVTQDGCPCGRSGPRLCGLRYWSGTRQAALPATA